MQRQLTRELNEAYALFPSSLMGHQDEYAKQATEVLINMNQDIDRLHNIWANCRMDIEHEVYPPAFFIEWALTKHFRPDWLDWAIERKLYIASEPTIEVIPQPTIFDKPLSNKERETFLIIIAALAKEAKLDIAKPSKAGELIANMTALLGVSVSATTIENKLKEIPKALESRAK